MALLNVLVHALALIAPAWALALIFVSLARWACWRDRWYAPWYINVLASGLLGSMCMLLALVLSGEDGTVWGYAGLVLANATLQWALWRGR